MLITFKSKAAAEVIMYAEHARMLLDLVGKPFEPADTPRGVITPEQLPGAVAALRAATVRAAPEDERAIHAFEHMSEQGEPPPSRPVSLAQRAWPLLHMLELAERQQVPVTWGV